MERSDKGIKRGKYIPKMLPRYRAYILKCNRNNLELDITEAEYKQLTSNRCFYCGGSVKMGMARINMRDGYVKDNVRPCCCDCNILKYGWNERDFLLKMRSIIKYQDSQYHSNSDSDYDY